MSLRIEIRPAALDDIDKAAAWYEARQANLGAEFVREIRAAIDRLPLWPHIHVVRHRSLLVRWTYPARFPYRIIYRIEPETLIIFAILHAARADSAWEKRL